MDVSLLSDRYIVQMMGESDVERIYELCRKIPCTINIVLH